MKLSRRGFLGVCAAAAISGASKMPRRSKGVSERLKALNRMLRDKSRPRSELETNCIQRLIGDLENEGQNGLYWNEDEAQRNLAFAGVIRHWKGDLAGRRFQPEPWQSEGIIAPMFGWERETDSGRRRRFTVSYVEVPRKNGKTFLSSFVGNQGLIADHEHGPEVYFAATTRDQASMGYRDSQNTIRPSPELMKRVRIMRNATECPGNLGTLQPVSSDYNFLQGKNPSRVVIDELHAHKSRDVWDALLTGFGARSNPLMFAITTAGFDRTTVCWEQHEFAREVASGVIVEPTYHSFMTCADELDDPFDPWTWKKANPNFGVSVNPEFLATEARKARHSPSYENTFRRLYLNQWTQQNVRWINLQQLWDPCADKSIDWETFRGRKCYAALDLASTRDLCSLAMLFPDEANDKAWLRVIYWMPREANNQRSEQDRRQLMKWAGDGLIRLTDGNEADVTGQIPQDIYDELTKYRCQELAYDTWGSAVAVCQQLGQMGVPHEVFRQFRQTVSNFSPAVSLMERMLASRRLTHDGDPCLRWQVDNVSMREDANGNKRPDKSKSAEKIDGVVASLMAVGSWQTLTSSAPSPTYYDTVDTLETVE